MREKEILGALVKNLQRLIKAKGYTSIERFAYENGLSKGGLGKILQGQRIPRFDTIVRIANALEVSLNDIYPVGPKTGEAAISKRLRLEKIKTANRLLSEVLEEAENGGSKKKS